MKKEKMPKWIDEYVLKLTPENEPLQPGTENKRHLMNSIFDAYCDIKNIRKGAKNYENKIIDRLEKLYNAGLYRGLSMMQYEDGEKISK